MKLSSALKICFIFLYILWAAVMFASMPPDNLLETLGVLAFAAVIFVAAYYFYLLVIRGGVKIFRRHLDKN